MALRDVEYMSLLEKNVTQQQAEIKRLQAENERLQDGKEGLVYMISSSGLGGFRKPLRYDHLRAENARLRRAAAAVIAVFEPTKATDLPHDIWIADLDVAVKLLCIAVGPTPGPEVKP